MKLDGNCQATSISRCLCNFFLIFTIHGGHFKNYLSFCISLRTCHKPQSTIHAHRLLISNLFFNCALLSSDLFSPKCLEKYEKGYYHNIGEELRQDFNVQRERGGHKAQ